MCNNDTTPCCWLFRPKTILEIEREKERLYDENDHDILFTPLKI